jgi:hypothetical protein
VSQLNKPTLEDNINKVRLVILGGVTRGTYAVGTTLIPIITVCYLTFVIAGAIWISRGSAKGRAKESAMEWSEVKDGVEILAHPEGVWTLAYEYVKGPALIKIETTDEKWAYAPGKTVNAKGDDFPERPHRSDDRQSGG